MWVLETAKFTSKRLDAVRKNDVFKVGKYYGNVDTTKYEETIMTLLNSF